MRARTTGLMLGLLVAPMSADKPPSKPEEQRSSTASAQVGARIISLTDLEPPQHVVQAMENRPANHPLAGILVYE